MSRSEQMARIKGRNTTPERRLRAVLWASGMRYRLRARTPVGRPDIVFPGARVAVFIDGCFWHGCPLHYVTPRTRRQFWAEKLAANVERDRRLTLKLEEQGWRVVRVWEHEVEDDVEEVAARIEAIVRGTGVPSGVGWRIWKAEPIDERGDTERRHLVGLRNDSLQRVVEGPRNSRSGPRGKPA